MRTDTIFYELFQTCPGLLFELIGKQPSLAQAYQFTSVEVKELARTMDGLFLPTDVKSSEPIYFLEVQFQKDNNFYWRFLTELLVYIGQYKPQQNWQAVVVWAKRSLDPGVPIHYQAFLASNQLKQIYLDELDRIGTGSVQLDIVKLVVESEAKASKQVKPLIQKAREEVEDESLRRDVIELIEKVLVYKFTSKSREELRKMIYTESEWKQSKLYKSLREEAIKDAWEQVKEEVKQEAIKDAREQVKEEVKQEVEQEVKEKFERSVLGFLKLGLTVEQIATGLNFPIEKVRQISDEQSSN